MSCQEFCSHIPAYVDGELGVAESLAVGAHLDACPECWGFAERERQFRALVRCQPREAAPPELRARIRSRCQREARWRVVRPWLAGAGALAALLILGVWAGRPGRDPASTPLVSRLVAAHVAFVQVESPTEFMSPDPRAVEAWFTSQASLRVTVPDYSAAGIRLVGGRIAEVEERRAAYVVYEKGRTLLSLFVVPARGPDPAPRAGRVTYRGREYVTDTQQGFHTVSWSDGDTSFGLVSALDFDALLECADRLRSGPVPRT
jgi:mycothiol system anti-sigma-R factor